MSMLNGRNSYGPWVILLFLFCPKVVFSQVINDWKIDDANLTNGKVALSAGEVRSLILTVNVTRFLQNGSYPPVSIAIKPVIARAGFSNPIDLLNSNLAITTSDFSGSQATKNFTVPVQAVGGLPVQDKLLRDSDKIVLLVYSASGWITAHPSIKYDVEVALPPITGNQICCGKCIIGGTSPGVIGQASGTVLSGGDMDYEYQWQSSTDGANYTGSISSNPSYAPGNLTQTTWFKRKVSSKSTSSTGYVVPVESTVQIEVINASISPSIAATNYSEHTTIKGIGTITIQGNQTHSPTYQLYFISDSEIVIKPSSILQANTYLRVGQLCSTTSQIGRVANRDHNSVNHDGTLALPQTLDETSDIELHFRIFPNPASSRATIEYLVPTKGRIQLIIVDIDGSMRIVLRDEFITKPGSFQEIFEANELSAGLYSVMLYHNDKLQVRRLIVLGK